VVLELVAKRRAEQRVVGERVWMEQNRLATEVVVAVATDSRVELDLYNRRLGNPLPNVLP
jgi:hypothetical protein